MLNRMKNNKDVLPIHPQPFKSGHVMYRNQTGRLSRHFKLVAKYKDRTQIIKTGEYFDYCFGDLDLELFKPNVHVQGQVLSYH